MSRPYVCVCAGHARSVCSQRLRDAVSPDVLLAARAGNHGGDDRWAGVDLSHATALQCVPYFWAAAACSTIFRLCRFTGLAAQFVHAYGVICQAALLIIFLFAPPFSCFAFSADSFHKPGFKLHARILHHLYGVVDGPAIKVCHCGRLGGGVLGCLLVRPYCA